MQTTHKFGDPRVTWIDVVNPPVEELEPLADEYGLADRTFDEAYQSILSTNNASSSATRSMPISR